MAEPRTISLCPLSLTGASWYVGRDTGAHLAATLVHEETVMPHSASRRVSLALESLESRLTPDSRLYVRNLYTDILVRQPNSTEIDFWVTRLQAGQPAIQVAQSLEASHEKSVLITNNAYVEVLHRF